MKASTPLSDQQWGAHASFNESQPQLFNIRTSVLPTIARRSFINSLPPSFPLPSSVAKNLTFL